MCVYIYIYIHIYIYIYTHIHVCIYIYIYRKRERERWRKVACAIKALTLVWCTLRLEIKNELSYVSVEIKNQRIRNMVQSYSPVLTNSCMFKENWQRKQTNQLDKLIVSVYSVNRFNKKEKKYNKIQITHNASFRRARQDAGVPTKRLDKE